MPAAKPVSIRGCSCPTRFVYQQTRFGTTTNFSNLVSVTAHPRHPCNCFLPTSPHPAQLPTSSSFTVLVLPAIPSINILNNSPKCPHSKFWYLHSTTLSVGHEKWFCKPSVKLRKRLSLAHLCGALQIRNSLCTPYTWSYPREVNIL